MAGLFFALMTPSVEIKVKADGVSGASECRVHFRSYLAEEAKSRLDRRDTIMEQMRGSGFADTGELEAFLAEDVIRVAKFPIVDETGKLRFTIDTQPDDGFKKVAALFEGIDISTPEMRVSALLDAAVLKSFAWKRAFHLSHIYALQNIKPLSEDAQTGN